MGLNIILSIPIGYKIYPDPIYFARSKDHGKKIEYKTLMMSLYTTPYCTVAKLYSITYNKLKSYN